jgi:hypothetical protein
MQKTLAIKINQIQKISLFFVATLLHKCGPLVSRLEIEAKARSIAKTFTVESTREVLPPPLEIKINGLYVLLSKIDIVMDKKQLEKPEDTMVLLMKLEIDGPLGNVVCFNIWSMVSFLTSEYSTTLGLGFVLVFSFFLLVAHPIGWWRD